MRLRNEGRDVKMLRRLFAYYEAYHEHGPLLLRYALPPEVETARDLLKQLNAK